MFKTDITETISSFIGGIEWITDIYIKGGGNLSLRVNWKLTERFNIWDNGEEVIEFRNNVVEEFLKIRLKKKNKTFEDFQEEKTYDFKFEIWDKRFRVNASILDWWKILLIFRIINHWILGIDELWIKKHYLDIALNSSQWLFIVSWPTWSGKSTTLSSIIDYYNEHTRSHIITLEDPIEQKYTNKMSIVHQFELWEDFNSFEEAMENILRQDPDIIVVGEIRSRETLDIALRLAETWHLVFWTMHWKWANWVITRIARMYENEKQVYANMRKRTYDYNEAISWKLYGC